MFCVRMYGFMFSLWTGQTLRYSKAPHIKELLLLDSCRLHAGYNELTPHWITIGYARWPIYRFITPLLKQRIISLRTAWWSKRKLVIFKLENFDTTHPPYRAFMVVFAYSWHLWCKRWFSFVIYYSYGSCRDEDGGSQSKPAPQTLHPSPSISYSRSAL